MLLTVSVVVVHLCQHVDGIRIELQVGTVNDSKSVELVPKSTLPKDELRRIRPIETVNAVCSAYSPLELNRRSVRFVSARFHWISQEDNKGAAGPPGKRDADVRDLCETGSGPEWKNFVRSIDSSAMSSR